MTSEPTHRTSQTQFALPGRTIRLAALGVLGVAGDHVNRVIHLDTLFRIFVRRGERVEQQARTLLRRKAASAR